MTLNNGLEYYFLLLFIINLKIYISNIKVKRQGHLPGQKMGVLREFPG